MGKNESLVGDKLYTVKEACYILRKTNITIYNWIERKKIRASRPGGELGNYLISGAEILRVLSDE